MNRRIVSVLHHSIKSPIPGKLAEELGWGWHFKTAKALAKYGGFSTVAVRPSGTKEFIVKQIDGIRIVLTPTIELSISDRLWKWSEVSLAMVRTVKNLTEKHEYIPYIHEYRALNSELIIKELVDYPLVLQHHGSFPPHHVISSKEPKSIIAYAKGLLRESIIRKIRGAIFVLNRHEKKYLEDLGVEAIVKVRPMAVDFDSLRPVDSYEKAKLRTKHGIAEDSIVLFTYVGTFREEFSTVKGAHLLPIIWKTLRNRYKNIELVVCGLGYQWIRLFRSIGMRAYEYLPHPEYIELLKLSDIFILPATPCYYYGGPGVAVMEALALGKPVVTPTLIHIEDVKDVKYLGILTPFIRDEITLKIFIDRLAYLIESMHSFNPCRIRETAYKYFSWESFVREFLEIAKKI